MLQTLLSGLTTGAVYALVGIGYNIVFIGAGIINFSQAQLIMVGSFLAYAVSTKAGTPLWLTTVICGIAVAILAVVVERVAVRPLWSRTGTRDAELVTTLGVALALDGAVALIWGTDPVQLPFLQSPDRVVIGGAGIYLYQLVLLGFVIAGGVAFTLVFRRTRLGIQCLAASENRTAAMARGINVKLLSSAAFAASGLFLGIAAPLYGAQMLVVYNSADPIAILAFVVLAIGGLRSIPGSLVAGLLLGLLQAIASRYTNANVSQVVVFGSFVVFLLLMPGGIAGRGGAVRDV
jgi:branched-chain amino acid transport system permease protein